MFRWNYITDLVELVRAALAAHPAPAWRSSELGILVHSVEHSTFDDGRLRGGRVCVIAERADHELEAADLDVDHCRGGE